MPKVEIPDSVATLVRSNTREEWLAARRFGVGASEAAALFTDPETGKCASPWLTPLKLYAEKVGEAKLDEEATEAQEVGQAMEPAVAELARRRFERLKLPVEIDAPPEHSTYRSNDLPAMTASPDRFTVEGDIVGVLELKTSDHWFASAWRDEAGDWSIPLCYQIQVQQQLAVLGLTRGRVAALVGRRFLTFYVERSDGFAERLMETIAAFMRRVEQRLPPDPTPGDLDAVKKLYRTPRKGTAIALSEKESDELREWVLQDAIIKAAEERVDVAKARIALAIGDFDDGVMPDGAKVTHRAQRRETKPHPGVVEALALLRARVASGAPLTPEEAARMVEVLAPAGESKVWTGRILLRPRSK